ncbi:MAG TPA: class II D-tagatose-bisphosphate aldolase, non-catalytic subunit [Rectinemataceae bacterium]|nr:class II D-tagatose-bisphosphate aldolase, non-catalytic subunit [Rectinemataceae bacterium]
MSDCFTELRAARLRGEARGLYSVCSSNPFVLEAAARRSAATGESILVEATANQVNQDGGYTGLSPADFAARLGALRTRCGADKDHIVFGGDHLGPYPWRRLGAEEAMARAETLVSLFVAAGARKIHLDASMVLGGDFEAGLAGPLGFALHPCVAAERSARLCAAAEAAFHELREREPSAVAPVYVIGTEVPVPGGVRIEENAPASSVDEGVCPTNPEDFRSAVELHRRFFDERGLSVAWGRVLAVVVQPGVEFDANTIHRYDRKRAAALVAARADYPWLLFEGHSTDFQPDDALAALVEDGVCVLKVGPALTFALREALFGLDAIAGELGVRRDPGLAETAARVMRDDPEYWRGYYAPDSSLAFSLKYAYSDRIRYYWNKPAVLAALENLFASLRGRELPRQLLSQYLPRLGSVHGDGSSIRGPEELALAAVNAELGRYAAACHSAPAAIENSP